MTLSHFTRTKCKNKKLVEFGKERAERGGRGEKRQRDIYLEREKTERKTEKERKAERQTEREIHTYTQGWRKVEQLNLLSGLRLITKSILWPPCMKLITHTKTDLT